MDALGSAIVTAVLAWSPCCRPISLPSFMGPLKPNGPLRLPAGSRIAMSSPRHVGTLSVVAETWSDACAADVPHDTWLADEDPSEATLDWWPASHGVLVSTRKAGQTITGHMARRTPLQGRQSAFFYDHYGYDRVRFCGQLDPTTCPHRIPLRNAAPFADPEVVTSRRRVICDRNASESWVGTAAALHAEASMHGALQAGYNGGLAPLCIGSHYAVRTAALKEIGGLARSLPKTIRRH